MPEFDAGVLSSEAPVHVCFDSVALALPDGHFSGEKLLAFEPAVVEALSGEHPDLDLGSKLSQLPCLGV